jgi:hypothetical protein
MKKQKAFPFISCFVMVLSFLIFSFSYIAMAEETPEAREARIKNCISECTKKQLVCLNLNPDRRLCAAEDEKCVDTCHSEGALPSASDSPSVPKVKTLN